MNKIDNVKGLLKTIFIVKIIFLFLVTTVYFGWLYIGDLPILAEGINKTTPSDANASLKQEHSIDQKSKTSIFLEKLLTLPELDVNSSTKDEIGRYLTYIEQAKQQVDDRVTVLKKRALQLKKLEDSIDKKLKMLEQERQFFTKTIQQEKEIQKDRLETLVALYAKMEPKKAAPVFEGMDKDLVISLFKKMKEKQVTKILETMNTEKSVELTEYFGRIGSAKEYDLLKEMNKSLQLAFNECKS